MPKIELLPWAELYKINAAAIMKRWPLFLCYLESVYWRQPEDKKTLKKINNLIKDIERNGVIAGIGRPETLKHEFAG